MNAGTVEQAERDRRDIERRLTRPFDDFAEFLTDTYWEVLRALERTGIDARVVRVGPGQYVVTGTRSGRTATLTDQGRPVPDSPADADSWLVWGPEPGVGVPVAGGSVNALVTVFAAVLR